MRRADVLALILASMIVLAIACGVRMPTPTGTPTVTLTLAAMVTPTDAARAIGLATPRSVRGAAANAPLAPTVVPILYKFFDWGSDFQHTNPEWGPVGSVHFTTWGEINPAPGVYNWTGVDDALAAEAALRVTMPDGAEIPKPVVIQVEPFLSSAWNWDAVFFDCTPQWLYQQMGDRPSVNGRLVGHVLSAEGKTACVPYYDSSVWRDAFFAMVRAFGARYNNDPRVTAVVICVGLDGETQVAKEQADVNWDIILDQQAAGVRYRFNMFVYDAMDVYREAFPTKPIFINNAPGGSGMRQATSEGAATYYAPPIGLKNSSLWVDQDSHQGYGDYYGRWDAQAAYSMTVPIVEESVFGLGGPEEKYWTLIAGLHYHPQAIDLHPQFFTDADPAWLRFTTAHLGRTITDTSDIWCVLRDSEYPLQVWNGGESGISGHIGDWTYWLYRVDAEGSLAQRIWRQDLPAATDSVYSRQARRTQQAWGQPCMSFATDMGWTRATPYTVSVTILNYGEDTVALQYERADGVLVSRVKYKGPTLGPVGAWVTATFVMADSWVKGALLGGADFRLSCEGDGDEYVHMVCVEGRPEGAAPLPTPSSIPSPIPTRTPEQVLPARRCTVLLSVGWNLVCSPFAGPVPVENAIAGIAGKVTLIYAYREVDGVGAWDKWMPDAPGYVNTLKILEPTGGYWVMATEACAW